MIKKPYIPDRYKAQSTRLLNRDYSSPGAYFVTTNTYGRQNLFEIPHIRQLLQVNWLELPTRFSTVRLDEFVIMPDHLHFIIWLGTPQVQGKAPSLGNVVGAYKSLVAVSWLHHIKENDLNCSGRIWQDRFYERVVRKDELQSTRHYIRTNPYKARDEQERHGRVHISKM